MKNTFPTSGLYIITHGAKILGDTRHALNAGVRVVQYRDKTDNKNKRIEQASELKALCDDFSVPLIVNDDINLALDVDAAGVHLGKNDGNLQRARQQLGNNKFIGISCYNDLNQALLAQTNGANYVAFGRFFPSKSKPDAIQAGIHLLTMAKQQITIPIVAIGGITADNGQQLVSAGADLLAVINAVYEQPDPYNAADTFKQLFT